MRSLLIFEDPFGHLRIQFEEEKCNGGIKDCISSSGQLIVQRKQHTAERHGLVVGNLVFLYENYMNLSTEILNPPAFKIEQMALFTTQLNIIHSSF